MKAVMYHYVREPNPDLPHFIFLDVENFRKQIRHFLDRFRILSLADIEHALETGNPPPDSMVLTFDDGLADHYDYVYPVLKEFGVSGLFYVPTGPYEQEQLLDVHRTHYLLGRFGGKSVLAALRRTLRPEDLLPGAEERFAAVTYTGQKNSEAVREAKRLINYRIDPRRRTPLLTRLMLDFGIDEQALAKSYYLSPEQMQEMAAAGMGIGSHAKSHTVLSNLDAQEQHGEIHDSFALLQSLTGGRAMNSFCFPYGGKHSYNDVTLQELKAAGCRFGFTVESRDISPTDLRATPFELPRYDCNEFPFGLASGLETGAAG